MSSVAYHARQRVKNRRSCRAAEGPKHTGKHLHNWQIAGLQLIDLPPQPAAIGGYFRPTKCHYKPIGRA